jgi:UDP-N-acetylglucosamine--N-acetylmuramyl-(pentapeptide) pyrophosphoryl-undecaprenol N-acetylglucosamine transferase
VPFPHAVDDHQTGNAQALVEAGAAELIQERDLDTEKLSERLSTLLADRARLVAMAEAARAQAKPDAAETIARACLEVAA